MDETDFERLGYGVAEQLGESAFALLGNGLDGYAFALESGRTLKLTRSQADAALAALVLAGEVDGADLLPTIYSVTEVGLFNDWPYYAIVREDVSNVFEDLAPEEMFWVHEWKAVIEMLAYGLANSYRERIECALEWHEPYMPSMHAFVSAALEVEERHGIIVQDLTANNVGIAGGQLVVRDWGGFSIPSPLLRDGLEAIGSRSVMSFPGA